MYEVISPVNVTALQVLFATFFALTTVGLNAPTLVAVVIGAVGAVLVWVATRVTDRWRRA